MSERDNVGSKRKEKGVFSYVLCPLIFLPGDGMGGKLGTLLEGNENRLRDQCWNIALKLIINNPSLWCFIKKEKKNKDI